MDDVSARVQAHHDQISTLCDMVQDFARAAGFDPSAAYACSLAAVEACENILRHGYGKETDSPIVLTLSLKESGSLVIRLVDEAPPFNASLKPEQIPWTDEDPPVGGLGLHIIHKVMDDIRYRRDRNSNILEMTIDP